MTPFYANYGYRPWELSCPIIPTGNRSAESGLAQLAKIRDALRRHIEKAQEDNGKHYNERGNSHLNLVDQPLFTIGDKVWLNGRNIATSRPSRKLDYRLLDPSKITGKVSHVAYRLQSPQTMDVHNTLHVSQLEPYRPGHPNEPQHEDPPNIIAKVNADTSQSVYTMVNSTYRKAIPAQRTRGNQLRNFNTGQFSRCRKEPADDPAMFLPANPTEPET